MSIAWVKSNQYLGNIYFTQGNNGITSGDLSDLEVNMTAISMVPIETLDRISAITNDTDEYLPLAIQFDSISLVADTVLNYSPLTHGNNDAEIRKHIRDNIKQVASKIKSNV